MTLVRFAPSPTGRLHVGNVRGALLNWLFARARGGRFLLRIDDTDRERSRSELAVAIEQDLAWLGLDHDLFARQSDRGARYVAAFETLIAAGRLYPAYETAEELEYKRNRQRARGMPPVYDRSALELGDADRARLEAEGRVPHWRFRLSDQAVEWTDLLQGPKHFPPGAFSDPVLFKSGREPLYSLASVVDDIELGVTHVIRGEDHVANTAAQIELFQALGGPLPAFAHYPLLVDAAGQGLSKRLGSLSIDSLREQGLEPMTLNSYLAFLGTAHAIEPRLSLADLARDFDLGILGRASPRFDPQELSALNAKLLHLLPFEAVQDRLPAGAGPAFWEAVRRNLSRLADAADWWPVVAGGIQPELADPTILGAARETLPPEPWDAETWKRWTGEIAGRTGAKGKALYLPLRLALTGRSHGPELAALLPLIGRDRAAARLAGRTA